MNDVADIPHDAEMKVKLLIVLMEIPPAVKRHLKLLSMENETFCVHLRTKYDFKYLGKQTEYYLSL